MRRYNPDNLLQAFDIIFEGLERIENNQRKLLGEEDIEMAQIDDLNAAITAVQGEETTLAGLVSTIEAQLVAAQQNQGVDLSGPIANIQALGAALTQVNTSLTTAETPASTTPPAGSSTPAAS